MDMFQTRFAKEGILNPRAGQDYRNMVSTEEEKAIGTTQPNLVQKSMTLQLLR